MSTPVTSSDSGQNLDRDDMTRRVQNETFAAFGEKFEPAYEFLNTHERVQQALGGGRQDNPPEAISPWECRIGGSKFFVPPINIAVSSIFKSGNMTGGAIRQQQAPKFNSGHSETVVSMTVYFPSYEEIFGFEDEIFRINFDGFDYSDFRDRFASGIYKNDTRESDEAIDKFLSSLRGLIAQFKYSPFLPVRNDYLNRVFGITGVALKDLTISTIPDYPFAMAATLTMYKFNHKVYMPMIEHFDQAIHWGRFRQYMGRAAGRLAQASRPIETFDMANNSLNNSPIDVGTIRPSVRSPREILEGVDVEDIPRVQTYRRHSAFESNMLEFFYPLSTPAGIELPDLKDLRYDDIVWSQQKKNWWQRFLDRLGFNVNTNPDQYRTAMEMAEEHGTGFIANHNEFKVLTDYLTRVKLALDMLNNQELNRYFERRLTEEGIRAGTPEARELRMRIESAWFYAMYRFFMEDPSLARAIAMQDRRGRQLTINEWEVPMVAQNIDMDTVKVQGISVSMGNILARLQLQLQDEPTHQHIGGADTRIDISLRISGEKAERELVKFRTMFQHTGGIARLSQTQGVLGFLGIKNIMTELVGVRYVVPLAFEVDTVPGFPHVYDVRISLTDFDIFQQKREALSAEQQAELAEAFGKRNPFLRIKQMWGMFNAYPDFPLSVRDDAGKIVGHLDPDFYFRSFEGLDEDIFLSNETRKAANMPANAGVDALRKAVEEMDRESAQRRQQKLSPFYNFKEGEGVHFSMGPGEGGSQEYVSIDDDGWSLYSDGVAHVVDAHLDEPTAANMIGEPQEEGMTPPSDYMQPYIDQSGDPWFQFEAMSQDMLYRDQTGRMIRAYPTYMLWLIDEGGTFAGMKLFDNFYGLQSVIDMSIVSSEDILGDTLVLRVSNLYSKLSTRFNDYLEETNPGTRIINQVTRGLHRTLSQSGYMVDLETMQLQPGIRVHLRLGYGANPNRLETVFNGVITEVHAGEIMTIVAQSDAIELSALVNSTNEKGHSGKEDGGLTGLYMSEPRDLMITLLTQGSTKAKEVIAHATQGEVFSENRYGIRHFGTMFYEPLDNQEIDKIGRNKHRLSTIMARVHGDTQEAEDGEVLKRQHEVVGMLSAGMLEVMNAAFINLSSKRDYEVFKRNIYPGNGTGIGQFLGGDIGEYGLAMAVDSTPSMKPGAEGFGVAGGGQAAIDAAVRIQQSGEYEPGYSHGDVSSWSRADNPLSHALGFGAAKGRRKTRNHNLAQIFNLKGVDTSGEGEEELLDGQFDEVAFRAQTYMKSVWDLFLVCAALLPDYVVAVRPFEDRSTVFYGKPHWLYTSGLIPLTMGLPPEQGPAIEAPDKEFAEIYDDIERKAAENSELESFEEMFSDIDNYQPRMSTDPSSSTGGMSFTGNASGANLAARAALAAGFTGEDAVIAVAIAGAESRWVPNLNNSKSNATGMWQIMWSTWKTHPEVTTRESLHDPFLNARVAKHISDSPWLKTKGYGKWSDWAVHPQSAARGFYTPGNNYSTFMTQARQAVEQELRNARTMESSGSGAADAADRRLGQLNPNIQTVMPNNNHQIDGISTNVDGAVDHETASKVYNWEGKGRSEKDAEDIWSEVKEFFPTDRETERAFLRARQMKNLTESQRRTVKENVYDEVVTGFLNFMHNNPYAYGWVVRTTSRRVGGFIIRSIDAIKGALVGVWNWLRGRESEAVSQADRKWSFDPLYECFTQYINFGDDAAIDYMKTNFGMGRDSSNIAMNAFERIGSGLISAWNSVTDAIKKPFQAIGGVATGLLSFMRLQMMQLTNGLSLANNMTIQTNHMNRAFNDSIYYSAGRDEAGRVVNPLLYWADNPFTREYGEPVVEVREPFQRMHTIGSFQHILDNSIIENLDGVATVVTASSAGEHPVTVHFDKGAPSERQTETVVDTGLFYDHPKGWFGLKKIFNPIETTRYVRMSTGGFGNGTNMETTAKRVALWHLKRSLQDIYQGQLTILGDSSIRPHDMVYLGDVYEKMYGFFEVEEVVHHFTPETGFITTIKPNACVTINDPARFLYWARKRAQEDISHFRDHMRAQLGVHADNAGVEGEHMPNLTEYSIDDIVEQSATQIQNSIQFTGGTSAIITSIASMGASGGILAAGGAALAGASATTVGVVAIPGIALGWKAWTWVRDNLLDQQGCYINYMTKNGRPMDAGLSYNAGVAVGHQHVKSFVFKGLKLGEIQTLGPDGNPKIRVQDVSPLLQWNENGPNDQARAVSLFVDRMNAEVRRLAGREGLPTGMDNEVYWARINRVVDGDTFYMTVLGQMQYGEYSPGRVVLGDGRVRPAGVDAPEDEYKSRSHEERTTLYANDPGVRATEFARQLLMPGGQGIEVALRISKINKTDQFGRSLAYVFHRAPEGLTGNDRRDFILSAAARTPPIAYDSYMPDGQPYTFDWEMIAAGHGKVFTNDMKRNQFGRGVTGGG